MGLRASLWALSTRVTRILAKVVYQRRAPVAFRPHLRRQVHIRERFPFYSMIIERTMYNSRVRRSTVRRNQVEDRNTARLLENIRRAILALCSDFPITIVLFISNGVKFHFPIQPRHDSKPGEVLSRDFRLSSLCGVLWCPQKDR